MIPITVVDLMIAIVAAIVTVVAAKNLPGLQEVVANFVCGLYQSF